MTNRMIATSIPVDPDKFHAVLRRHRTTQVEAGGLIGMSAGWAANVMARRRANFYRLDQLANALGLEAEDFIAAIAPDPS